MFLARLFLIALLLITLGVVSSKLRRGQRTAVGRAWTDQIEGFRTYLSTAEAESLNFQEGEDLFTRYLPWAVLFGACALAFAVSRLMGPVMVSSAEGFWPNEVSSWVPSVSSRISCRASLITAPDQSLGQPDRRNRNDSIQLKRINRAQFKDLGQFIQCCSALNQQLRVGQITVAQAVAVMLVDPASERFI